MSAAKSFALASTQLPIDLASIHKPPKRNLAHTPGTETQKSSLRRSYIQYIGVPWVRRIHSASSGLDAVDPDLHHRGFHRHHHHRQNHPISTTAYSWDRASIEGIVSDGRVGKVVVAVSDGRVGK
jgi:hypothetical protein